MAKYNRITNCFPSYYRLFDNLKLLHEVIKNLAMPLEEADTHLFRIQRSHRLKVSENIADIVRLAAVLNLTLFHFEDIISDKSLTYERKLQLMRDRVARIARLHLKGLGTPWAMMEGAAIAINAEMERPELEESQIVHIDPDWFSHKVKVFNEWEGNRLTGNIYLHENPFVARKVEPAERWLGNTWHVQNQGFSSTYPIFSIFGVEDRCVLPKLINLTTQEAIEFNGIILDNEELVLDSENGAWINKAVEVTRWSDYYHGGSFDLVNFENSLFTPKEKFQQPPYESSQQAEPIGPIKAEVKLPSLPMGVSQWKFYVNCGVFDGADFNWAVFAPEDLPIGIWSQDSYFDESVFDYPPSAIISMRWYERIPYSIKLLLPSYLVEAGNLKSQQEGTEPEPAELNFLPRVSTWLQRYKAAGIKLYLDYEKDSWILGESIIRAKESQTGEGVKFHSTALRDRREEIRIKV